MSDTISDPKQHEIVQEALAGNFRAVARLLSIVENGSRSASPYLRELFPHTGRCFSIGITGAPGAGKSTFVDRLAEAYRAQQKRVGIIAVDPTSPYSGGAILGDRIRMQSRILDPGVFIRSMASRGHMGGLSSATGDALIVMDAAGFDVVIIETVGVGQGEVEVAQIADVTIVLMVPGMGDDIQNMKAGIMEIADLFVINKADRPGVDKTEHDLRALVALSSRPDGWEPAIVRTVALEGTGTIETLELITKYRQFVSQSEVQKRANIQKHKNRILELVFQKAQDEIFLNRNADKRIQELAYMVADRKMDPYTAAEEMWNSVTEGPGQDEC